MARPAFQLVITAIFLLPGAAAAQYAVGTDDLTLVDPARDDRSIPVDLYYPATSAGAGTPVADPPTGGFAAVAFGHGYQLPTGAYAWIAERLAGAGCVVALPRTADELFPDHGAFGLDLAFVARTLRDAGGDPGSPFHARMGPRTLVTGHSMGGGASFLAAASDPGLTAVANFAAAETDPSAIAACGQLAGRALLLSGTNDCVTPPLDHQVPMYEALGGWRTHVTLTGASHCQFNAYSFLCAFGEFCSADISRQTQQDLAWTLLEPWVRAVLFLDTQAAQDFQTLLATGAGFTCEQAGSPSAAPPPAGAAASLRAVPNPFNASVSLRGELAAPGRARLELHDLRGRRVRTLAGADQAAVRPVFRWDGRDDGGRDLPSGAYVARLVVGGAVAARSKVVLVR